VQTFEGGKTRMPSIAEQQRPDLMIVDGMCCDRPTWRRWSR
jgi:pilus assembly protein CpaE